MGVDRCPRDRGRSRQINDDDARLTRHQPGKRLRGQRDAFTRRSAEHGHLARTRVGAAQCFGEPFEFIQLGHDFRGFTRDRLAILRYDRW